MRIDIESATVVFDKAVAANIYSIMYLAGDDRYQVIYGSYEPGNYIRWDVYCNGAYVGPAYLTHTERTDANTAMMLVHRHNLAIREDRS